MDPFIVDQSTSEDSASVTATEQVFRSIYSWMAENKGKELQTIENQIAFLRKVLLILNAYSPISTWGTTKLGDLVPESLDRPIMIQELFGLDENRPKQLGFKGVKSFASTQWEFRVVPLKLQKMKPHPHDEPIYTHSDYEEVAHRGRCPRKRLEKRLFLDRDVNIIAVELHSNLSQGNVCRPHQIDVGVASDDYLINIFDINGRTLELILVGIEKILEDAMEQAQSRAKQQQSASSVLASLFMSWRSYVK